MPTESTSGLRVLLAEDEPSARDLITAIFDAAGWNPPITAENGVEALDRLGENRYDILLTDLSMPRLGGEELVKRALHDDPDLTVIVLTGNGSVHQAVDLLKNGVFDFLTKPFSIDQLISTLEKAKDRVMSLTGPRGMREVLGVLLKALESKDRYLDGHCERVAHLAVELGRHLGLDRDRLEILGFAALMHDVGKIGVSEQILSKEGPLTPEEYAHVRLHPIMSRDILSPVTHLRPCLPAVLHHHERWDGQGYPSGLSEEEIPIEARIIAVVDAYDAMTSTRSYRNALPDWEARRRIEDGAGSQFDPAVAQMFLLRFDEIRDFLETEELMK